MSLPQLIVDSSSGRRKVPMVKFLTPIYVYFYCFSNIQKIFKLVLPPLALPPVGNVVGTIQLIFTVSPLPLKMM